MIDVRIWGLCRVSLRRDLSTRLGWTTSDRIQAVVVVAVRATSGMRNRSGDAGQISWLGRVMEANT